MLKYGDYGKYRNKIYKITVDMDDNIFIMTRDSDKIDKSFKDPNNTGLFEKIVNANELTDCIRIKPYGILNGEKLEILKERENEYQVATSDLLIGTKLKLPRIDRDLWMGWVPKSDVTLIEDKKPFNPNDLV
ncbi:MULTISPECIES: hypothetical protein [unclassified Rummeliibacillus]|mgnify:CR=1 FL=1|uniref:hypothetical protein n=1 Tax=unclassified Rummeliibacillus TaxID=2622809 RepID=UPI000F51B2B4|nr:MULTISPECIES: hypothetical protein [unclassified Rummeliibacillus]RPJ94933.1 hypothetical protein CW357_12685 [Rummeliibacillus sp. TYF005]